MTRGLIITYVVVVVIAMSALAVTSAVKYIVIRDRAKQIRKELHIERRRLWDIPGNTQSVFNLETEMEDLYKDRILYTELLTCIIGGITVLSVFVCLIVS